MSTEELKVKSFRITDETAQKFKEIANTLDSNQQETLAKLIETYEFQTGKVILTDKKAEIEQFERYTTALVRMFMGCLEDNQNITETVRTEFDALLKSKDAVIQQLQKDLQKEKGIEEAATQKLKALEEDNAKINRELENQKRNASSRIDDLEKSLNDKEKLNITLLDTCDNLKKEIQSIKTEYENFSNVQEELNSLKVKYEQYEKENLQLKEQLEKNTCSMNEKINQLQQQELAALAQQEKEATFTIEKKILEMQVNHQKEIQELKKQHFDEIETYQQNFMNLLQNMQKEKVEISKTQVKNKQLSKSEKGKQ